MVITDDMPLRQVKDWLRKQALKDGARCPCCEQMTKVYRRKMTAVTGRAMVAMYRLYGDQWVRVPNLLRDYLPDVAHQGGYAVLAQHWELIEESVNDRDDGGRAGFWRLTAKGVAFVEGELVVPKYAHIYNGRCLGHTGEAIGIRDVLGSKFDYAELMSV